MRKLSLFIVLGMLVACGPRVQEVEPPRLTNPSPEEPPREDPPKEDPPKEDPPKEDPPKQDPSEIELTPRDVEAPGRRSWIVGESVQGRPLVAELYGASGPVLFLLSAIHGNERLAVTFGEQVRTTLLSGLAEEAGVRVVFLGRANPDGAAARTRHNVQDIDLNRNFDTDNFLVGGPGGRVPLSEPETQALAKLTEQIMPSGVVSVHCCIPTMDYDGPGRGLATSMATSANDVLDDLGHRGREFPVERLGSSPGSMGSYVGVDLNLPIITLEFASNHIIDALYQLEAIHAAIDAAISWTSAEGFDTPEDLEAVLSALEREVGAPSYRSWSWPTSSGALTVRVDDAGDELMERPVMLLSGVRDNALDALYVAEHLRLAMLEADWLDPSLPPMTILTAANPEGLADGSTMLEGGAFEDLLATGDAPEVVALREVLEARAPRLVILIEHTTEDAPQLRGDMETLSKLNVKRLPGVFEVDPRPLEGPLAGWLRVRGIDVVRVGVDGVYAEGEDRRDEDFPWRRQQLFSGALLDLLERLE